jgi:molecular chaperone DnaK (HSP70)
MINDLLERSMKAGKTGVGRRQAVAKRHQEVVMVGGSTRIPSGNWYRTSSAGKSLTRA